MGVIKKLLERLLKEDPEIKKLRKECTRVHLATDAIGKHALTTLIQALVGIPAVILANHPQSPLRQLNEKIIRDLLMSTERFFGRQPDEKKIGEIARILADNLADNLVDNPLSSLMQPDDKIIEEFLAEISGNHPRRKLSVESDEENTRDYTSSSR
jgi:hypothetical protein